MVIPVHNCADYLAEALPEVLAQLGHRDDAEILVVDDASTDDPAQVVETLGRGRVRYRPNPGHLGAIATFNRCVELARGELVHLLHGDDLVRPGFYPAMELALADPTMVAAVCRVQDVDAHGSSTYITRSYRNGTGLWTNALDALAVSNRVRTPGIVVRRAAYEQVGGYRTDLPHAADWEMWTRLAAYGPVVFVDEVLAGYRRHEASDTSTRVRSGANIRERVTAIGVVAGHVRPDTTSRYHPPSAGVRRRVRPSIGVVLGPGRPVVHRGASGPSGRPLCLAVAARRTGDLARCRGHRCGTDDGVSRAGWRSRAPSR